MNLRFAWDPPGRTLSLIDSSTPEGCHNEKDFERSLHEHLERNLPGVEVVKQYGWNRTRIDIVVGGSVAIELKHNLDTMGKYERLVGQCDEYKRWDGTLVL